jgi:hypothetical protein
MVTEDIQVRIFQSTNEEEWDEFLTTARNADFMHTRKFLNYHGDNFKDFSLMIYVNDVLGAVIPISRLDGKTLVSHGGASYGGICFLSKFGGETLVRIGEKVIEFMKSHGYRKFVVKVKPSIYSEPAGSEDLYIWWRNGAAIDAVNLSNAIQIERMTISSRRQRALRNANSAYHDVLIEFGFDTLERSFEVCKANLLEHRGIQPLHNLEQLEYLYRQLPENLLSGIIRSDQEVLAGIIFFMNSNAAVVQYWGSSLSGRNHNALDILVIKAIDKIKEKNLTWFVPGISSSNQGQRVDVGIYEYKRSLGSGSISTITLKIDF